MRMKFAAQFGGKVFLLAAAALFCGSSGADVVPIVLSTWRFEAAATKAWEALRTPTKTSIDAVIEGCSVCEREQCDGTVGFGGSPDESGETALDAFIMDGTKMNVGAVAAMRNIKDAIAVAEHVLRYTEHSLLVGERATRFAVMMGFRNETLSTPHSRQLWTDWKNRSCQPNFWTNVAPDPTEFCGPYEPTARNGVDGDEPRAAHFGKKNHDTIGMIAIDGRQDIAAGTSTNGAAFKIPGRVGDSAIPGAGAYADSSVGAAAATGDGDVMMRFLPSLLAVEFMRTGSSPQVAGRRAIKRIQKFYPKFFGGIIVLNKNGEYGAACNGMSQFPFAVGRTNDSVRIEYVKCVNE